MFTRNATEAINLVAYTWARANLKAGDVIVLSHLEHHANVVPWHILAAERGVELRWIPLTADQRLDLTDLDRLLDGASLLAVTAMSNVVGTIVDIPFLVARPRRPPAPTCSSTAARPSRRCRSTCSAWAADFVAFSSHKLLGPTGIGALWARAELLEAMPPFLGGGEMIRDVTTEGFTTNDIPWKFEAGTPAIVEAVGIGAADRLPRGDRHGRGPRARARRSPSTRSPRSRDRFDDSLTSTGPPAPTTAAASISFLFDGIHAHDVSQVVDEEGVCVRAGHHCAKPLMRVLGIPATTRASFGVYNDRADADALVDALVKAEVVLRRSEADEPQCRVCKTSTERSSSTTTARPEPRRAAGAAGPEASRVSTRCAATKSSCSSRSRTASSPT